MSFGNSSSTPKVKPKKAPKPETAKTKSQDSKLAKKYTRLVQRQSSTVHTLLSAKADGVVGAPNPTKSYTTQVLGPKAGF